MYFRPRISFIREHKSISQSIRFDWPGFQSGVDARLIDNLKFCFTTASNGLGCGFATDSTPTEQPRTMTFKRHLSRVGSKEGCYESLFRKVSHSVHPSHTECDKMTLRSCFPI